MPLHMPNNNIVEVIEESNGGSADCSSLEGSSILIDRNVNRSDLSRNGYIFYDHACVRVSN